MSKHVVQLFLCDADSELVFAVDHKNDGLCVAVVRSPQVAVCRRARHVEHCETDVVFGELLNFEPNRRYHFVVLMLLIWRGRVTGGMDNEPVSGWPWRKVRMATSTHLFRHDLIQNGCLACVIEPAREQVKGSCEHSHPAIATWPQGAHPTIKILHFWLLMPRASKRRLKNPIFSVNNDTAQRKVRAVVCARARWLRRVSRLRRSL
eukprot:SAG31_NODE_4315_length_3365_cov_1.038579_4_plen_206_part_00